MKALELAHEYADSVAGHRLESLYGTSKSYTLEKAKERDEAHEALATELSRLAAVEAELERIKALEPVAWRSSMGHGVTLKESITDEQKALVWDGKPMWQPLIALGSKT